ncbi:MAG TPA: hypothetical protein VKU82_10465, partial [Planctomycetaceae bacterium]|nr:hypothetical protein [Planctomycetaceae bacterium]
YGRLAEIWEASSKQMLALCRANGIRYFHFLQPNQYIRGTKPMSDEETKNSFLENHPYREGVERGYPLLQAAGKRLAAEGEPFFDLTGVFETTTATVYTDTCCHFGERGNEIMALRIAEAIGDSGGTQ